MPVTCSLCEKPAADYGTLPSGARICYACAAVEDRRVMRETGRIDLYLVKARDGYHVTNWPGTLDICARRVRKGSHNIAGTRYDVWFAAEGREWHGVNYGENSQILRCRVLKAKGGA